MRRTITAILRPCALGALFLCVCATQTARATAESKQAAEIPLSREDIFIPHMSTVPANVGQRVGISVRHVTRNDGGPTRGAVLFTNGGFTSTLALLDLDYKTYSFAAALAADGFDVYLMDHTG